MNPEFDADGNGFRGFPENRSEKGEDVPEGVGGVSDRHLLSLLYGPAARCKPKMMIWRRLVLRFWIRPIDGAFELLAIMDYPRAFDLIHVSASKARRAT